MQDFDTDDVDICSILTFKPLQVSGGNQDKPRPNDPNES